MWDGTIRKSRRREGRRGQGDDSVASPAGGSTMHRESASRFAFHLGPDRVRPQSCQTKAQVEALARVGSVTGQIRRETLSLAQS
jgi:hypothetical protein